MAEDEAVFIVNVQPRKLDNGKYVPRASAIRRARRHYTPVVLTVEEEECFTALAAVQYGRARAKEILEERLKKEVAIEFVDWKDEDEA
jgi:hypothetical protein